MPVRESSNCQGRAGHKEEGRATTHPFEWDCFTPRRTYLFGGGGEQASREPKIEKRHGCLQCKQSLEVNFTHCLGDKGLCQAVLWYISTALSYEFVCYAFDLTSFYMFCSGVVGAPPQNKAVVVSHFSNKMPGSLAFACKS